jgi:hypothetical protein
MRKIDKNSLSMYVATKKIVEKLDPLKAMATDSCILFGGYYQ